MVRTDAVFSAGESMTSEIAVMLSRQAEKFAADLTIEYGSKSIRLDSLIGVLSLELKKGMTLTVVADGTDETEAAAAICRTLTKE
jgi:phosphotransferase system HPr (HPr) family protein